jgi:hypothetical protein
MTTTHDAVEKIANTLAAIERNNAQNAKLARGLADEFKAISENGDASPLLTSARYAEIVALTSGAASAVLTYHHQVTEDAKALNIDVPPAQETQEGEIGILSGGGR